MLFHNPNWSKKVDRTYFSFVIKKTEVPLINNGKSLFMELISIDRAGCAIYKQINAFIIYPFLAYNQNNNISYTDYKLSI